MLFVQIGDVHVHVHSGVVDELTVNLLIVKSFIERFVKGMSPYERSIVRIQSLPIANIPEYRPPSNSLFVFQNQLGRGEGN